MHGMVYYSTYNVQHVIKIPQKNHCVHIEHVLKRRSLRFTAVSDTVKSLVLLHFHQGIIV